MSKGKLRRILQNLLLVCVATVGSVWLADRYVAFRGLDRARMTRSLYFQNAYVPVHEISDDPVLHYELKAGATYESGGKYGPYSIHIGPQRARGVSYPVKKAPGVYRILCFGPSTTFGADVNDDESIPAQLETYLRARLTHAAGAGNAAESTGTVGTATTGTSAAGTAPIGTATTGSAPTGTATTGSAPTGTTKPTALEVWNFGTSAYVPIQTAWLAMKKLASLEPDLLIMMFNNGGRRAFLNVPDAQSADYLPWFKADPSLWDENFPAPRDRSRKWHRRLLSWSAIYRYVVAQEVLQRKIEVGPHEGEFQGLRLSGTLVEKARAAGVSLVVVSWDMENLRNYPGVSDRYHIRAYGGADHGDAHPPADVLRQMAIRIGSELVGRGIVPVSGGPAATDPVASPAAAPANSPAAVPLATP